MDRLANLLNAAATAITDAQAASIAIEAGLNHSTTATILTLGQHPGLSLSQLSGIVGLSHSAAVRLVDGLTAKGLAMRGDGQDRREVAVSLTVAGRALYTRLRQVQGNTLMPLLEQIAPADRASLERALSRILGALTQGRESADHICRYCDENACAQKDCPVELRAIALSAG
ncbi:MarR family winged helix-turn-helix transcriptional regulator [Yoonia vestfoldensis]|uniref:MarR family winged helix-turn-helix transcriptional regulator n=1 Tax=Yoonia vestfoldensis TaxID=245188 RepID=UPI000381BFDC|nr:MarR family transcriptional regulator [Yoonia vestfoldensis]